MVRRFAWITAIAGSVIFAAITAALFSSQSHIRIPAITALVTFSAIILSHLGGIENGLALREEAGTEATRATALVLGTVPSLAAWGVLWLPTPHWQVGASLALFAAVWAADLWLARHGLVPAWFVDLRTAVTAVVCVILAIAWALL
ncbi:MAG TPA: DUF3429 domain-containing protein [Usitatibacter sp.]|nr:DUF3429 domain-containing protein [Usitatibacter sp.]